MKLDEKMIARQTPTRFKVVVTFISLMLLTPLHMLIAESVGEASFTWSIVYSNKHDVIYPIDFNSQIMPLSQSDKLKIYLKHDPNVFLYLFLHDAEDNLYLLFPRSFADFDSIGTTTGSVFIPEGLQWFEFKEGSGIERFYLLASTQRLHSLEDDMRSFARSTDSYARQRVLEEVRRLQLDHYELVLKAKSDVVLAAGEFRGLEENFEFPAQHVVFSDFYSRTIRISH